MELFSFTIDWTIIIGVKDVAVFSDEACTLPLGNVHMGQIPQGETRDFTFYAKNQGEIPTDVLFNVTPEPADVEVMLSPTSILGLPAGASEAVTVQIIASPTAALEAGTVTVVANDGL